MPGVADARMQQSSNNPTFNVSMSTASERVQVGLTERDVANSLQDTCPAASGSRRRSGSIPRTASSYPIVAQTPQYWLDSVRSLENVADRRKSDHRRFSAAWRHCRVATAPAVVSHYAVQPVFDIFATNSGRDLGAVSDDIPDSRRHGEGRCRLARPSSLRGQTETMATAFRQLFFGLALARSC